MVEHNLVLLPGLDGTGNLFGPLLQVLPPEYTASVISYPTDQSVDKRQVLSQIRAKIPWDKPVTLVAESFSGPFALEFAAAHLDQVNAVVLVCTFVKNPAPDWVKWAHGFLKNFWIKRAASEKLLRKFLLGDDAPPGLVNVLQDSIRSLTPEAFAGRVEQVFTMDARVALQNCRRPILYLLAEQDRLLGKRGWETMALFRPNMTTVVVDGPHLLLQRKPRECFAAIEMFLKSLAKPAVTPSAGTQAA